MKGKEFVPGEVLRDVHMVVIWIRKNGPQNSARGQRCVVPSNRTEERIFIELMTSDRKLKASREGSK